MDQFTIYTGDDNKDYRNLKVAWKIPTILERNSEITGFTIKYNDTAEVRTVEPHYNTTNYNAIIIQ